MRASTQTLAAARHPGFCERGPRCSVWVVRVLVRVWLPHVFHLAVRRVTRRRPCSTVSVAAVFQRVRAVPAAESRALTFAAI